MRYVRVSVYKGKLNIGFDVDANGRVTDPGLDFQLFDEQGAPVTSDFRGEVAWSESNETWITPNIGAYDVNVHMYRVSKYPTPESVEYLNGWRHAMKLKRKVWPKDKSPDFMDGFRSAWQEREKR